MPRHRISRVHPAVLILALLLASASGAHPQLTATNLLGASIPLSTPQTRAVVLYFIASDCPISNRFLPEMKRLVDQYSAQDVRFWFVYPNATETPSSIRTHLHAFSIDPAQVLTDPHQRLAQLANAHTTPESAILSSTLQPLYTGRLDDRYLAIGKERPRPTRHDLADAIAATLAGRHPDPPGGPSVGCTIVSAP